MAYAMEGKVFHIGEKIVYSSQLVKQEIGITKTDNSAYPNVMFEMIGDTTEKAASVKTGDTVLLTFEVLGKGYLAKDLKHKFYTVLRVTDLMILTEGTKKEETQLQTETK